MPGGGINRGIGYSEKGGEGASLLDREEKTNGMRKKGKDEE